MAPKKNSAGLTLIELVVVIVVMAILSVVVAPMISMSFRVSRDIEQSQDFGQQAAAFFAYLRPLFLTSTLSVIQDRQVDWVSDGESYSLQTEANGDVYNVTLTQSGTTTVLLTGLAESGGNAQFLMQYYNRIDDVAQEASDVAKIEFSLTFQADDRAYTYHRGLAVQNQVLEYIR